MTSFPAVGAAFALIACAGQAPLAPLPQAPSPRAPWQKTRPTGAVASPASVEPVVAAARPVLAATASAEAPPALGEVGSAGPVQLLATSTSGAWVAFCNAVSKQASLVLGSGEGETVDDVLAQDPTGRYLVSLRDGVAELVDAVSGTRVDLSTLGADVRRVRSDYAQHRTLSFDARGRYLAYLRKTSAGSQVVVRALQAGTEQVTASGPGEVFRLRLSPDARHVTFEALRDDTNHNGKLDWPAPEETPRKNGCDKPSLPKFRSFAFQGRGDALSIGVISVETGGMRDVPELLTPLGASLLVREADGSLRLDRAGKRSPLAPASCGARVLFADAERELVLASCAPPPAPKKRPALPPSGKREVWLFGAGYAKNLQSELYETSIDREAVLGVRLVPLYPGSEAGVLDLERRELLPLAAGSRVVASDGAQALIWRNSALYRYDAVSRGELLLAQGVLKNPDLLQAGSTVLLSPFLVVGCAGPALASPRQPLALSASGFVLTAAPASDQGRGGATEAATGSTAKGVIQGPLRWVDARLPTPDSLQ